MGLQSCPFRVRRSPWRTDTDSLLFSSFRCCKFEHFTRTHNLAQAPFFYLSCAATLTCRLAKIGEGPDAEEVALWPAVFESVGGGDPLGEGSTWMHVQLEGECGWEKQHNLRTSGTLNELPVDEVLELWCTERRRVPAQPLPPGFRLLEPKEVMEVVYHDECAYKQNDSGGAAWENDEKGAAMNPKNEGAAVMVSDLIGEERGQLDIPPEVYAIMKEHGQIPKVN